MNEDACIADTSSVFLIDQPRRSRSDEAARAVSRQHPRRLGDLELAPCAFAVGPGLEIVLAEGHAYAAVLTSRVKSLPARVHLVARLGFQSLLSGKRTGAIGALYGGAIDQVQAALKGALTSDNATIVAIAPFTTQSITGEMFKLRESLESMPVPKLAWDATSMAPMGAMKFAALVNSALPAGFTASLDDGGSASRRSSGVAATIPTG